MKPRIRPPVRALGLAAVLLTSVILFGPRALSAQDVEMLARAEALGYEVEPVPVAWHHREGGTVRLWGDSPRMLAQLWRIRRLDLS